MRRKIIPYNPALIDLAKKLRNTMTIGEIALWQEFKGKKLCVRFSRQIPIDRYIVDFYCKDLKLAIEVDGSIHFEKGQEDKDKKRQTLLASLAVNVIRCSDADVKDNLSFVLENVKPKTPTPKPS
jgi:very-short-patch-repair endonuclease